MNIPLVSIICNTYNHASYISQCLNGFFIQRTNFPFEVLVHDDASTDNTPDIIREYECKYPQILKPIYQKENQYSKGKDIFFDHQCLRAKGKYIAICEGDDYWIDPLKLQKQIDFLESHSNYALVYTLSKVYDQANERVARYPTGSKFKGFNTLLAGNQIPALTTCIRTNVIIEYRNDVKPQEQNWLMGDYPMWLWIAFHYEIMFLPEETTVYRVLEESASHSQNLQKQEKFTLSIIDIMLFYIDKFKISPTQEHLESINQFYYELYDKYMHEGCYKKSRHYAKILDIKYIQTRKHKKVRLFYLRYLKYKFFKAIKYRK